LSNNSNSKIDPSVSLPQPGQSTAAFGLGRLAVICMQMLMEAGKGAVTGTDDSLQDSWLLDLFICIAGFVAAFCGMLFVATLRMQ